MNQDCLNIFLPLLEPGVLQNYRIQVAKNSFIKKKHHKFKLLILKVQGIGQHIADNLSLPQFKQLDVRTEFIKGEPSTVNDVMTSIDLYLRALDDLLILNQGVQLTTDRV